MALWITPSKPHAQDTEFPGIYPINPRLNYFYMPIMVDCQFELFCNKWLGILLVLNRYNRSHDNMEEQQMKSKIALISLLAAVLLINACDAKPKKTKGVTNTTVATTYQDLEHYFQILKQSERLAGSMAIYKDGQLEYEKVIIVDGDKLKESDQVYRYKIGSISKTFTSVLIFQLIDDGKLTLDTKLSNFFPKVANAKKITIKQMLNHHSGIDSYTDQGDFATYFNSAQTNQAMLDRISQFEADFEPGKKGEYSNSNFLLLGYIIEQIAGKDYGEVLTEKIAKPLGLKATYLESETEPEKNEVFSYMKNEGWKKVPQWNMSVADAAGALVSTTADLNSFFKALFDGKLITKTSLETMLSEEDNFGHGIFKRELELDNKKYFGYWHNGRIENFTSNMIYYPEQKIGITALFNGTAYDGGKIFRTMTQAAFGGEVELPEFKEIKLSIDKLKIYEGDYASDTHPLEIKVMVKKDKLYAQATGQGAFPLTAIDENTFEFAAANIEMKFDPENKQFVIKQGGRADIFIDKSIKKVAAKVSVAEDILKSYVGLYKSDDFPLDIEVMMKKGDLYAQATGQSAFPLTAVNETEFKFDLAGIKIKFDTSKKELMITQGGRTNVMIKE